MLRVVCALLAVAACKRSEPKATPPPPAPPTVPAIARDPHSQAVPDQLAVTHLALELTVDFTTHELAGTAKLTLVKRSPAATQVVLDTDGLAIASVVDCTSQHALPYTLGAVDALRGQALTITPASDCVAIAYRTAPAAKALLWVEPAGTAGKKLPMLFTQSQAILARTWIPLQDSPGVRFTYDATIHVPPGMWALMSAHNPQAVAADGTYRFAMELPIPSYLMALAVGDFAFAPIGARTGVYAEPSVVAAAAHEFAEVDAMMAAAEKLYGPYRWGRYDMLVLPPSFPFGGMENPRLTFLTPTVIAGDRSLVSLIAHELAHSWSGNLVTNATWNDQWLNEGVTTYVERRIMEELRGKDVGDLGWALARKDLEESLDEVGRTSPDTRLALDFGPDRSPEDVPSDIAYEKGALFLRALEQGFGREMFDGFLRARFERLAFSSSDTKTFEADADAALFSKQRVGFTLAEWLHKPGLPASAPASTSSRAAALERAVRALATTGAVPDAKTWDTLEWVGFLRSMPDDVTRDRLKPLDDAYHLTASANAQLQMYWLPILIRADVREAAPTVEAFLVHVGRRLLVRTVYVAMIAKNEYWRGLAATVFEKAKTGYHPITRATIAELLAAKP